MVVVFNMKLTGLLFKIYLCVLHSAESQKGLKMRNCPVHGTNGIKSIK